MLDKANFWDHQYRKWKIDCYRKLLDKGYRPGDWGYPAYAGIDPRILFRSRKNCRLPRIRGDRPYSMIGPDTAKEATPHTRGSTSYKFGVRYILRGYPAYAGIDRQKKGDDRSRMGLPRIRGDRPSTFCLSTILDWATPHTRGSTLTKESIKARIKGYPAYAGIDPLSLVQAWQIRRLPRIRGDRPLCLILQGSHLLATPHTRGSTSPRRHLHAAG